MTSEQQFLLDARAAHVARTTYQRAADRLTRDSREMREQGYGIWADLTDRYAAIAQRAARNEYDEGVA